MFQIATKHIIYPGLLLLSLSGLPQARAQTANMSADSAKYTFQLPQMLEGGGPPAIVRAIQMRVTYPRTALRSGIQGQNQVTFAVAPDGRIGRVRVTRPMRADLDSAVVQAVRHMPRLLPATQHGKPVACLMTAPVTFVLDSPPITSRRPIPFADSSRLYTALLQMPRYHGGLNYTQLAADIVTEYQRLRGQTGCFIPRTNLGVLVTIHPNGAIADLQLNEPDEREQQALEAAYGEHLAHREEPELPAACVGLLKQAARRLPHLSPAYADGRYVATRIQLTLANPSN